MIKYSANAFLAMKITFINEIAELCEKVGADVQQVARGIGLDNRIGSKFLHAGPGYGGSCFPKDSLALMKIGQDYDAPLRLVETSVAVNDQRKRAMARKVSAALGGNIRGKKIAVLGLTFKPNTDDMREAPSIAVVTALQDMGADVHCHDPVGIEQAKHVLTDVTYHDDPYSCAEDSGCDRDRDRVGAVSGARSCPLEVSHAQPRHSGPAQRLLPWSLWPTSTASHITAWGGRPS